MRLTSLSTFLAPSFLLLSACEIVGDVKEKVEDYTNPYASQSIFLGVAEPTSADITLPDEWAPGARASEFLASASDPTNMSEAPVEGATVTFRSDGNGSVVMDEAGNGSYKAEDLVYTRGESVKISIEDTEPHTASLTAPPPAEANLQTEHAAGEDLGIDCTGQDFDQLLVVVINMSNQRVTYENTPDGIQETYDFTHQAGSLTMEIPGSAFPDEALYAVGVAGLKQAGESDFDGVNPALSGFLAGQVVFSPVSTISF